MTFEGHFKYNSHCFCIKYTAYTNIMYEVYHNGRTYFNCRKFIRPSGLSYDTERDQLAIAKFLATIEGQSHAIKFARWQNPKQGAERGLACLAHLFFYDTAWWWNKFNTSRANMGIVSEFRVGVYGGRWSKGTGDKFSYWTMLLTMRMMLCRSFVMLRLQMLAVMTHLAVVKASISVSLDGVDAVSCLTAKRHCLGDDACRQRLDSIHDVCGDNSKPPPLTLIPFNPLTGTDN